MKIRNRLILLFIFVQISASAELFAGKNTYRIIFIGTSQTWGAGAKYRKETFVSLIEDKLNNEIGKTTNYTCINAGVSGSNSTELLKYYITSWTELKPKLVIINLSNNDGDVEIFHSNLKQFIRLNKQNNIKTMFILEANSYEQSSDELYLHKTMIKAGIDESIMVINLHKYLRSKKDAGIIWWDRFHLTSFGHKLTADFIFPHLLDLIKEKF